MAQKTVKSMSIGKSRLLRKGNLQTWIKAELLVEFEEEPTITDVREIINDIDAILKEEEVTENARWNASENKLR